MLGAEWRDRVVILGACVLAFIFSASFDLIGSIHDYLDYLEQPQADKILTALMVTLDGRGHWSGLVFPPAACRLPEGICPPG